MSSTTNSITSNDQNSNRKSKKKSTQNLHAESTSNSNQNSNKHLNNITNNSARNNNIKLVNTSKIDKKKASLENILIDQAIKSNQSHFMNNKKNGNADKTGTFITEAMLSASLLRGANSKSDLSLKNVENSSTNESVSKKQNKKQRSKVQTSMKVDNDDTIIMNGGSKINKSLSTPVINNNTSVSHVNKASTSPAINTNSTKSKKDTNQKNSSNKKTSSNTTTDIRDRYWAYLFENLKRSVDEIFYTCEKDNSISECKEVILILENCTNEFRSLASKIKLMNEYEKASLNNKQPTSLAWELSKSCPSPPSSKSSNFKSHLLSKALNESNENKKMASTMTKKADQVAVTDGFRDFMPEYANVSNQNSSDTNNNSHRNDEFNENDYLDDEDELDYDIK
jgi:hypothetical protein